MIKFDLPPNRTFGSFFQISFSQAEDLKDVDLPLGYSSFIFLAIKGGMNVEEISNLIHQLDERFTDIETYLESIESLDHHILYIFNI